MGLILFIAAFPALTWNEKRSVRRTQDLKEASAVTVTVDPAWIDPAREGAMVHFSGRADTEIGVADNVFGIQEMALKLRRTVEMYQWKEESAVKTEKKIGGSEETTTTYSYRKSWEDKPVASASFQRRVGHENPAEMRFEGQTFQAEDVKVGAHSLPGRLIARLVGFEGLEPPASDSLPGTLAAEAKVSGGHLYFGADPANPAVGDHRVRFEIVKPKEVTVVARQAGKTLEPYMARSGGEVDLIRDGEHAAEAMFLMAHDENRFATWLLRFLFFVLMAAGLSLLLRPATVIADVVPFAGRLVGAGLGFVAIIVAAALSCITIALAWLAFRPLIGVPLLLVAVGLFVWVGGRMRKGRVAGAAA